jgi:N-acetylglucosamine kinase-like BadF-type ATPase
MKLIVDSGSTKTEWVFVKDQIVIKRYLGSGFNPYYFKDENYLLEMEEQLSGSLNFTEVENIYFYGSGCSTETNCTLVKTALWESFTNANIVLHHDLYGAAVALCGANAGIACILGTGSNSCLWDGQEILENVPSVGYLLGDEGSGTYLGKIILAEILMESAPKEVSKLFYDTYDLDFSKVLDRIYKEPNPNKLFASISKFTSENIAHPWLQKMVKRNFNDFIDKQVSQYSDFEIFKVSFVGSVSMGFKDILLEVLKSRNLKAGKFIKSPVDELVKYHLEN